MMNRGENEENGIEGCLGFVFDLSVFGLRDVRKVSLFAALGME